MFRVLLSGAAGSGKGTVARMLQREFDGFNYFSAGDLIREHIHKSTEFGQRAAAFLNKGELIPDTLLNGLLLQGVIQAGNKAILDGYPRTLNQVKLVEDVAPISLFVEISVPKKVLIDRMGKQLVHKPSGREYNLDFNPPKIEGKDDITGEQLERREDDAAEIVRRRLEVHEKTEKKVMDYYKKQGLCLEVSGENSDVLFQQISEAMVASLKSTTQGKRGGAAA